MIQPGQGHFLGLTRFRLLACQLRCIRLKIFYLICTDHTTWSWKRRTFLSPSNTRRKLSENGLLTPDNCVVDLQPQMLFGASNFDRQPIVCPRGICGHRGLPQSPMKRRLGSKRRLLERFQKVDRG